MTNLRGKSMFVKCKKISDGPGPSEEVIAIITSDGDDEEVVVHKSLTTNDAVKVLRIGAEKEKVLVELPRESMSGNWRIWIPSTAVFAG